jgi:hypothetical protein
LERSKIAFQDRLMRFFALAVGVIAGFFMPAAAFKRMTEQDREQAKVPATVDLPPVRRR